MERGRSRLGRSGKAGRDSRFESRANRGWVLGGFKGSSYIIMHGHVSGSVSDSDSDSGESELGSELVNLLG